MEQKWPKLMRQYCDLHWEEIIIKDSSLIVDPASLILFHPETI